MQLKTLRQVSFLLAVSVCASLLANGADAKKHEGDDEGDTIPTAVVTGRRRNLRFLWHRRHNHRRESPSRNVAFEHANVQNPHRRQQHRRRRARHRWCRPALKLRGNQRR